MRRSRRRVRLPGVLSVGPIVVVCAYVPVPIVLIARGEQGGPAAGTLLALVAGSSRRRPAMTVV